VYPVDEFNLFLQISAVGAAGPKTSKSFQNKPKFSKQTKVLKTNKSSQNKQKFSKQTKVLKRRV
jgi:hypothetical protein